MSTLRICRMYDHAKSALNLYRDLAKDNHPLTEDLRKITRSAVINAGLELNAAVSKDGWFIYNILELENSDTLKWCKYTDMDLLKSVYEKLGSDTFVEHEYMLCNLTVLFNIVGTVDPAKDVLKLAEDFGFTEYLSPEIVDLIHKIY